MAYRARIGILALAATLAACDSPAPRGLHGAYLFPDERVVSIRPSADDTLRYREYQTGRTGRLYRQSENVFVSGPGFATRDPVTLRVRFQTDQDGIARRLDWMPDGNEARSAIRIGQERTVRFVSDGTTLSGRLHLPEGPGPHPAVVLVHGSGEDPGSDWFFNGDFMVARGVAVLAYDKRGTGASEGEFTFDFRQLARDVSAAVAFLRSLPDIQPDRIGLSGYSQGGWVAPLAASLTPVRFVLVSYGMIESPAQEAQMEMEDLLIRGGVGGTDLAAANDLVTAAVDLVASGFADGWGRFGELRDRYRDADWLEYLDGTPVDQLMTYPRWLVRLIGPGRLPEGLDWSYDSESLLRASCVPMTWFLAQEDSSAPNRLTIPKLEALRSAGKPYDLVIYPGADHGMLMFEEDDDGRRYTGYAPGYFRAEVESALKWLGADAAEADPCRGADKLTIESVRIPGTITSKVP